MLQVVKVELADIDEQLTVLLLEIRHLLLEILKLLLQVADLLFQFLVNVLQIYLVLVPDADGHLAQFFYLQLLF